MSYDAMLPGFAKEELGGGSGFYTALSVSMGFGALIGTAALAATTSSSRRGLFVASTIVSGVAPILFGVSATLEFALPAGLFVGGSQAMFMAMSGVLIQETVPDALRGRVVSLYAMSAGGIMAFSALGYGWAADIWSVPPVFVVPGAIFIVFAVAAGFVNKNIGKMYGTGRMPVWEPRTGEAAGG